MKVRAYAMAGMLMCCLGSPIHALAVEAPRLSIQTGGKPSGKLHDGQVMAQIRIATQEAHVGFQVWSDGVKSGSEPNRYIVTGIQNASNTLRVRIEKEDARPDSINGKGLIVDTGDSVASFNIVSDGEQTIVADNYQFEVKAATINQNGTGTRELSDPTVQMASLHFNAEQLIKHEVWAALPVFPNDLADNTLLARGVVSTVDGSEQRMAVRFAEGSGEREGNSKYLVLSGKNDANHKLKVKLQTPDDVTEHNNDWLVKAMAHLALDYTINADGSQDVPTDTYTVRVESVLWGD
ncbi:AfaD family invasin [Serratia marcescens]|uniref:AfaD family invasin n=1 Tax=Serratia marcescens TaxID=615 RepID=UPI004045AC67